MESMTLIRFEQIKRFLNLPDPLLSMSAAQNELVEQFPTLCNKIKCTIFDTSWIVPPKDLAADKICSSKSMPHRTVLTGRKEPRIGLLIWLGILSMKGLGE
jgi:hypothetical protein